MPGRDRPAAGTNIERVRALMNALNPHFQAADQGLAKRVLDSTGGDIELTIAFMMDAAGGPKKRNFKSHGLWPRLASEDYPTWKSELVVVCQSSSCNLARRSPKDARKCERCGGPLTETLRGYTVASIVEGADQLVSEAKKPRQVNTPNENPEIVASTVPFQEAGEEDEVPAMYAWLANRGIPIPTDGEELSRALEQFRAERDSPERVERIRRAWQQPVGEYRPIAQPVATCSATNGDATLTWRPEHQALAS